MMPCKHKSGDTIQGSWVCAHCYKLLSERPKTYKLGIGSKGGPRQEIDWMASIAKTPDGVTLSKFVAWMVGHMRRKCLWSVSKHECMKQCLEALSEMGEVFGSDDACWDREDAKEIVNEAIIAYWDEAPAGANQ